MSGTTHMFFRILAVMAIVVVGTAVAEDFEIARSTIDTGGVMRSTGGEFELSGAIGQSDAGVLTDGDGLTLTGGFWFGEPPCDCNSTGGVNLLDYDDFEACLTGPGTSVAEGCKCFDVDRSDTVDLLDFAVSQSAFTG